MIILDTHVWLWWVNQDTQQLKALWLEQIAQADEVAVSAISLFEVAWLDKQERITLPCNRTEWFDKALDGSGIGVVPISPAIASQAVELAEHHRDPQDRLIMATSLVCGAKLLSADRKFPLYEELAGVLIQ
ncbi:MAG: twitching motility protein PilT [Gammaproteobacteria bacterium RIFOXYA12_FULL_61_12]|nr:MAG: twitching motility protein PilT [Gammaproteobacteria bacterium RIFOXYD12_FULL_61_37]OGT94134.1 MAG: twitching motility protein PilT [Gammaproteobacteria bacterium RIFOXYA12_FULL_61_12]